MPLALLLALVTAATLSVGRAEAQDPTRSWNDEERARGVDVRADVFAEPRPRADVLSERATVLYTLGTIASVLSAVGVVLGSYVGATCSEHDCILLFPTAGPGIGLSIVGAILLVLGGVSDRRSAVLRLPSGTVSLRF